MLSSFSSLCPFLCSSQLPEVHNNSDGGADGAAVWDAPSQRMYAPIHAHAQAAGYHVWNDRENSPGLPGITNSPFPPSSFLLPPLSLRPFLPIPRAMRRLPFTCPPTMPRPLWGRTLRSWPSWLVWQTETLWESPHSDWLSQVSILLFTACIQFLLLSQYCIIL